MKIKPQLAEDAILEIVEFPCWVQPKIDGVRSLNLQGTLTGRSLDPFEGYLITDYFSQPAFVGLDGEMTLGNKPNCTDRLCSKTTGAMGRFKGVTEMADLHWWLFDYLTPLTITLPYEMRYHALAERLRYLDHPRLSLVPYRVVNNLQELQAAIDEFAAQGYEGTITRNPRALYKEGRATKKGQQLWRVKPWADAEILVTGITEGERNQNEAEKSTLGRTKRSSAKAGKVPNGQVGSIQGTLLADFKHPLTGAILFKKGLEITVSPGEMTIAEAVDLFNNPHKIVGHIVKFQHMIHGVKDLPRFPGYKTHRLPQDMS
jgi:DNA ligase-1